MAYENLQGKLGESFGFKLSDCGKVLDTKTVFCKICDKSFSYSGSTSSLQYNLKHIHSLKVNSCVASTSSLPQNNSSYQLNLNNFISERG